MKCRRVHRDLCIQIGMHMRRHSIKMLYLIRIEEVDTLKLKDTDPLLEWGIVL
jgi:hypothetical protein